MIFFFYLTVINILFLIFKDLFSKYLNIYDKPDNILKKHDFSVPIIGGLQVFLNISIYFFYEIYNDSNLGLDFSIIYFTLTLFFIIGLYDDKYSINSILRLFLFILILSIFFFYKKEYLINSLEFDFLNINLSIKNYNYIFSIICFILFINALNLFDGINLQSGSYVLTISFYYLLFDINNILIFVIIIPLIFFLYLNFKNQSFLGDGGIYILGFLLALLSVKLFNEKKIHADQIFLAMAIPGYDMLRLFLVRIINSKNPFKGDRNHIHHIISSSYGKNKAFFLVFLLYIIPLLVSFTDIKMLNLIIIQLVVYVFTILYFFKQKKY